MRENLLRYRNQIDEMLNNNMQPQSMNVFNVGGTQIDFEARMIGKDEKPTEIMVQRRTAFICIDNATLTIKEINGDIKEYKITIPKTKEQLENEDLKRRVKELEDKLRERGKQ
jgi:DNA polymerase III sliding clamp (beta) subunit (PCNA family)